MNNDLIENSHLLPLNIDVNDIDQELDSNLSSIASDIEVIHTDQVNDDFARLNLSIDNSESEDKFEDLVPSDNIKNNICSLPTVQASTTTSTTITAPPITTSTTTHKRREWNFHEKLKFSLN